MSSWLGPPPPSLSACLPAPGFLGFLRAGWGAGRRHRGPGEFQNSFPNAWNGIATVGRENLVESRLLEGVRWIRDDDLGAGIGVDLAQEEGDASHHGRIGVGAEMAFPVLECGDEPQIGEAPC